MVKRSKLILTAASVFSFALQASLLAQSGRNPEPAATTPPIQEKPTPVPAEAGDLEKVKLLLSAGFEGFVKDLNDHGKLGYRLEKSLGYGGVGVRQSFAAVLRLDPGNAFEYDWLSSPNRNLLDLRL